MVAIGVFATFDHLVAGKAAPSAVALSRERVADGALPRHWASRTTRPDERGAARVDGIAKDHRKIRSRMIADATVARVMIVSTDIPVVDRPARCRLARA